MFLWKVSRGCTQRQNTKSYSKIDIEVYVRHTRQWREPCSLENSPTCSVHRYCSGLSLSGLMSKILEFSNNKFLLITSPMDFLFHHTSVLRDSMGQLLFIAAVEVVTCCTRLICAVNILTHPHGKHFCHFILLTEQLSFGCLQQLANAIFVLFLTGTLSHSLGGNGR